MPDHEAKLVIEGVEYDFPTVLTLGESQDFYRITGKRFEQIEDVDAGDPNFLVAAVYIVMHRADPAVKIEDVQALSIDSIDVRGVEEDDAGPPAEGSGGQVANLLPNDARQASSRETTPALPGISPLPRSSTTRRVS